MIGASKEWESLPQKVFRTILQQGSIPKHMAFILDGNRRYARPLSLKTIEGHKKGLRNFEDTIEWAIRCGVKTITAYVFSMNNFNRSEEEVSGIMSLVKEKNDELLANPEKLRSKGIRYQFVGEQSLFPKDLRPGIAQLTEQTKNNTVLDVILAFVYTGRNEITSGLGKLVQQLSTREIGIDSVDETLLEKSFQNIPMPPVDLLVTTSESRLSDFLTWASSDHAVLLFLDVYWPNYSYWKFLACILYYQVSSSRVLASVKNGRKLKFKLCCIRKSDF